MKVSFSGYGEKVLTFETDGEITAGVPVAVTGNGTVGPCAAGQAFCGVAVSAREGLAAVQLCGYARLPYSGAMAVGYRTVAGADGGKIQTAETGRSVLVTDVDESAAVCGVIL